MVKDEHVVRNAKGGWDVREEGATRARKTFDTQRDAIEYARTLAQHKSGSLYIHGIDGSISRKDSYGRDPRPVEALSTSRRSVVQKRRQETKTTAASKC
jgi:hypothetical protein